MKQLDINAETLRKCVLIAALGYEEGDKLSRSGNIGCGAKRMEQAVMDIITEYENSKLSGEETFLGRKVSELES